MHAHLWPDRITELHAADGILSDAARNASNDGSHGHQKRVEIQRCEATKPSFEGEKVDDAPDISDGKQPRKSTTMHVQSMIYILLEYDGLEGHENRRKVPCWPQNRRWLLRRHLSRHNARDRQHLRSKKGR